MRSLLRLGMLLAAAATTFASCSKDSAEAPAPQSKLLELTLTAGNPNIAPDAQSQSTRTEMEGTTPYWSVGDQIGVSTDGTSNHVAFTNDATERAQITTFSGSVTAGSTLYTYYPHSANGISGTGDQAGARVDLPANQHPTATSFDGKADLLIGKPLPMTADGQAVGSLQFKRMGAIVKVVLKDNTTGTLLREQHVSTLSIATDGEHYLAGRVTLQLLKGLLLDPYYNQSNKVTATYTSATQYAIDGTSGTYLGVFPRVLPAGSALTVEASTEGYNISRTITLAQDIDLTAGKVTSLNVGLQDEHVTAAETGLSLPFTDDFSWVTTTSTTVLGLNDYPKMADGTPRYSATASTYPETPALKFGTGSARGSFTTTDLDLSQPFTVIVKAQDYGTTTLDGSSVRVTAGEAAPQSAALTPDQKYFAFEFPAQGTKSKVKLDITGKRGYVTFFQVVTGHDIPLPAALTITSETVLTAAPDGDIFTTTYTVENPVAGASVTADPGDATWINTFDYDTAGEVTFIVDENDTGATRSGTVTFTYPNAEPQSISVTQPAIGGVTTYTATYTVTSKTAVTTSGTVPAGSTAAFAQTYASTAGQMTSGNSTTLTLSGYAGCTITGLKLVMHSNGKAGAGGMTMTAGTTTLASIADKTTFNNWAGSYGTAWVDVTPTVTSYLVQDQETVTITINATTNSLYIQSYTVTCEK